MGATCGAPLTPASEEVVPKNVDGPKIALVHGLASCSLQANVAYAGGNPITGGDKLGLALPCTYERGVWDVAWINVEEVLTGGHRLIKVLKMKQGKRVLPSTGQEVDSMVNLDLVEVRPYPGVEGIASLNPGENIMDINVWKQLTLWLDDKGFDMQALNYDWRRWGDEVLAEEYLQSFKDRIEMCVAQGGGKPIPVVSHSLGCSVALYCLGTLGAEWTKKNVKAVLLVAPVVMGAPKVAAAYAHVPLKVVMNLGASVPEFVEDFMARTTATWPSLVHCLPGPVGEVMCYEPDKVIVSTPSKKYTARDMGEFIRDLAEKEKQARFGPFLWESSSRLRESMKCPAVPTHIVYSRGFDTPTEVSFPDDGFDGLPELAANEDGDNTVSAASVERLGEVWSSLPGSDVTMHVVDGEDHKALIEGKRVRELIAQLSLE